MTIFSCQPVHLATGNPEGEEVLVFWIADPMAVLVRRSLKARNGHGACGSSQPALAPACICPPLFRKPEDAEPWFTEQISKILRRANGQTESLKPLKESRTVPRKT